MYGVIGVVGGDFSALSGSTLYPNIPGVYGEAIIAVNASLDDLRAQPDVLFVVPVAHVTREHLEKCVRLVFTQKPDDPLTRYLQDDWRPGQYMMVDPTSEHEIVWY